MSITDYERKLSSYLFNKTKRSLLALLFGRPDESFYVNQILQRLGSGSGAVQRELKMMAEAEIVVREKKGNLVYYRANSKSPIFDELKNIVRKTFGVADVIRESLALISKNIGVAFIFGSVAKSMDDRASDIDVMIIGEISFADVSSAISQAEKLIQREVNPVVYPPGEFKQKVKEDHHFVKTVLEGEKIFLIGDEGGLRRLAEPANSSASTKKEMLRRFPVSEDTLAAFCQKHHIKKLALFGSVLRDDFRPDSDIDVLVEFEPGHVPGFGIIDMENELSQLVGRKVDLRTPGDLSRYFREQVVRESRLEYADVRP